MLSGKQLDVNIAYIHEEEPKGTDTAIKNAEFPLKNEKLFFVLNGDIITNIDMNKMIDVAKKHPNYYTHMALVPMKSPYGAIQLNKNNEIIKFAENQFCTTY